MTLSIEKRTPKTELFYKEDTYYSLTICPDDSHQYFGYPNRMLRFKAYIRDYLIYALNDTCEYRCFIELSEPQGNIKGEGPRLHLHGKLKIRQGKIKDFLLLSVYRLTRGTIIEIDTIENMEVWEAYCRKQQDIIKEPPLDNSDIYDMISNDTNSISYEAPAGGRRKRGGPCNRVKRSQFPSKHLDDSCKDSRLLD